MSASSLAPSAADADADGGGASARPARRPGPHERIVFLVCAAVIALHLLLAAFVFVRPGVSRADHVLAALVPVALLLLSADLWSRLPAGLRASLSLVFGILALVTGGVAVSGARAEGLTATHATGALLLPAGAVLVGLGLWLLWVSRKRDGSLWWIVVRRALLALAALFVLYSLILPASLAIVATERPSETVEAVDLGRPRQDVTLETSDGLKLSAWYVPPENGSVVITFPRTWTTEHARMLVRNGYGVLMVDPRGYGESEGDPNAYGWGSARDIDAAAAWLRHRPEVKKGRIGGLGLSVGGEQMIEAAADNYTLKGVVSEGAGIRSVREAFVRRGVSPPALLLQFPQDLAQTVAVWLLGSEAPPPSLVDAAAQISPRAVFFIYGEDGQEIEAAVNPAYYAAAGEPKEIWMVPGAGHTGGIDAQPEEYERRVIEFFDRALLGRE